MVVGGQRWILNWPDPSYRREENLPVLINPEGFHRLEVGVGGGARGAFLMGCRLEM